MSSIARLRSALLTWPDANGWRRALFETLWLGPVLAVLAWVGGLTSSANIPDAATLAKVAAVALVIPAFAEEVVFRALLLPAPGSSQPFWRYPIPLAAFVVWHPLQVLWFGEAWGKVVLNPIFLLAVVALGFALARIYLATRSLWPCVLVHWVAVIAWKAFGGASPWA